MTKPYIFKRLQDVPQVTEIVETLSQALQELFIIEHPSLKNRYSEHDVVFQNFVKKYRDQEVWIYYPWRKKVIHTVSETLYFKIRTARNRNIITKQEQQNYRDASVGIAGLSVGSAILSALVISGGPKHFRIADFDVVEISNLNRIKATLLEVGMRKTDVAAKNIWEIDPFAEISLFESGINENNIENFILKPSKLNFFIDEMDSIPMKILLRQICRIHRIPVIMVTDNGNGIILDVERFDKEPKRKLLHGIMEHMDPAQVQRLDFKNWVKIANKIVGNKSLGVRMRQSISEIGKTISGIPQLGTSASLGAAVATFVVRNIANDQGISSGRYQINFENMLLSKVKKKWT